MCVCDLCACVCVCVCVCGEAITVTLLLGMQREQAVRMARRMGFSAEAIDEVRTSGYIAGPSLRVVVSHPKYQCQRKLLFHPFLPL